MAEQTIGGHACLLSGVHRFRILLPLLASRHVLAPRWRLPWHEFGYGGRDAFKNLLGGVADPQLQLQFGQQSLEKPRLPTGFHHHPYLYCSHGGFAIKLLRLLAMLQSSFSELTSVGVYKSNRWLRKDYSRAPRSTVFRVPKMPHASAEKHILAIFVI